MNKQNDSMVPDYSLFHRNINTTSSPKKTDEKQETHLSTSPTSSSSSKKQMEKLEKRINDIPSNSSSKRKINSYASTDEDVDEFNLDYSEDINRSVAVATIQAYRDRLNARLHSENNDSNMTNRKTLSTEYSQVTIDSGVDIASEQKLFTHKIDEHYSEETTNQNDLFALSDDSLLDIESPHITDCSLKPTHITQQQQSISFTDDSDAVKTFVTAANENQSLNKTDCGPSTASELYYSAESELNATSSWANNDNEIENQTNIDEDIKEIISDDSSSSTSSTASPSHPDIDSKQAGFGDWIDQIFTSFLAETNQQSNSTSRSSSILSVHASQNTIDTSSSQILTVIENNKDNHKSPTIQYNSIAISDDNNQMNSSHRHSQSWPSAEQEQDEKMFKGNLSCFCRFFFLLSR